MTDSVTQAGDAGGVNAGGDLHIDGLFRLDGRVALVTGGTRGIGRAIAEGFGRAGARVVVASRKPEACEETEHALRSTGIDAAAFACHMGSLEDVRALVAATASRFGGIDVLVNNAANALTEPIGEFTEAGMTKSLDVNVKGSVFLIQEAVPHLRKSRHASVINLVSAGAWLFSASVAHYAAAKAAMVAYTKALAAGLAPDGIRVNALAPGSVDTDMVRATGPAATAGFAAACLLRRVADAREMIGPALFLASDASSYVTGSVVHADGGLVTR
jgi:NAD(P)-dependent dehydrogenase (short-subunit alcohol dehydrogenase family)